MYERREMLLYRDITNSVIHDNLYENGSDSDETQKTGREPSRSIVIQLSQRPLIAGCRTIARYRAAREQSPPVFKSAQKSDDSRTRNGETSDLRDTVRRTLHDNGHAALVCTA